MHLQTQIHSSGFNKTYEHLAFGWHSQIQIKIQIQIQNKIQIQIQIQSVKFAQGHIFAPFFNSHDHHYHHYKSVRLSDILAEAETTLCGTRIS